MRYTRFIIAVLALFATACTIDPIDSPAVDTPTNSSDVVTVIGRITRFDDKDVATRGIKDQDEAKLTSMAMAIFKVNAAGNGLDGGCVYYQYADDQAELLFTIERGSNYAYDTRYAMYVFCNMPGMSDTDEDGNVIFGVGNTLDDMLAKYYEVQNIDIPTNGFPMMGSLGDTFTTTFDNDGKVFILSPRENGELTTPKVDGVTQTLLTIPMKAMFAKVNFTIEVRPDQTIDGNYSPQFTLEGYTVNNVPSRVDFDNSTNSDTTVLKDSFSRGITGTTVASGANKVNFTFYLPERYLEPTTKSTEYNYPFKKDGKIRGEDSVYMQRFKSKLIDDSKKATNIVISGRYRDHQNHYWDVDYTIYLGEDNYGDFNIKRNTEYHNYVTIRGIQSSNDMSDEQDAISIDHRVNVERTQPAIISLRREVLLDSHFEVRPLRIRKNDVENIPTDITHVRVEVVKPETTNWMRIERSAGEGSAYAGKTNARGESIYITDEGPSKGKRRYFTYNLVDGKTPGTYDFSLVNSTEVIVPLNNEEQCVWIYIDECTEVGDAVRSGIVKVTYGSYTGTEFTPANNAAYPDVNYVINQRKLFEVKYDDPTTTTDENRKYHIEYEEEYLHNFDADDDYGQTDYEGMQWGLEGIQLSYNNDAIYFESGWGDWIDGIIDWFKQNSGVKAYYDFYIPKHDTSVSSKAVKRAYRGYVFCNEIIQDVNGGTGYDNDDTNDIDVLTLNQKPKSAVEYCYNKNKRDSEGHVVWQNADNTYNTSQLNWYLPAIDEIEDIVMSKYENDSKYTYARFIDFQKKLYWSSQPAYVQNYGHYNVAINEYGTYYYDDINSARATKVSYSQTDGYKYITSGGTGYENVLYVRSGSNSIWPVPVTYNYTVWYVLWTETRTKTVDQEWNPDEGVRSRDSYARIRCVRKSQYTNTSAN